MKQHLIGIAQYVASRYNTEVGSVVFAAGLNLFAGTLPETPDFAIAILPSQAQRNPHDKTHAVEFDLVVRAPTGNDSKAYDTMDKLYGYLDGSTNVASGCPGIIRSITEPVGAGLDQQFRPLLGSKFVIWTVSV